jgi:hypothetical protein
MEFGKNFLFGVCSVLFDGWSCFCVRLRSFHGAEQQKRVRINEFRKILVIIFIVHRFHAVTVSHHRSMACTSNFHSIPSLQPFNYLIITSNTTINQLSFIIIIIVINFAHLPLLIFSYDAQTSEIFVGNFFCLVLLLPLVSMII